MFRPIYATVITLALVVAVSSVFGSGGGLGFTTSVSQRLIGQLVGRFGAGSDRRLGQWQGFPKNVPISIQDSPGATLAFTSTNLFFNHIPFVDDRTHWGIGNARVYLQEQLESHAQDTATSLGLSK